MLRSIPDADEAVVDWTPMGARFSNSVLQTLLVLFARRPPKVSTHILTSSYTSPT